MPGNATITATATAAPANAATTTATLAGAALANRQAAVSLAEPTLQASDVPQAQAHAMARWSEMMDSAPLAGAQAGALAALAPGQIAAAAGEPLAMPGRGKSASTTLMAAQSEDARTSQLAGVALVVLPSYQATVSLQAGAGSAGGRWPDGIRLDAQGEPKTASGMPGDPGSTGMLSALATGSAAPVFAMPGETASATLPVPLHSAEFPNALASQLGSWLTNGTQRAELKLNPAEMGPISVQLSLNAGEARISFAAASEQTRTALQDSLPQLSQLLERAGMTLLSADVSAQQGQSQPQQQQARSAAQRSVGAAAADAPISALTAQAGAPAATRLQGRLDLYA
jgi:flagellar hook-length control protein FliK